MDGLLYYFFLLLIDDYLVIDHSHYWLNFVAKVVLRKLDQRTKNFHPNLNRF